MQDFFALNLSALQKTSPNLAKRLQDVVPNTHYEVFLGDDVLNFNIIDTRDCAPIFVDSPLTQTNQKIVEFMPYAQYLYYGMLMVAPNGSAWAKSGESKTVTGTPLNFSTHMNANASSMWFEKAKDIHGKKWTEIYEKTLKGGI